MAEAPGAGDGPGPQELCKGWGGMWQAEVGVYEEVWVGRGGQAGRWDITQRLSSEGSGRARQGP